MNDPHAMLPQNVCHNILEGAATAADSARVVGDEHGNAGPGPDQDGVADSALSGMETGPDHGPVRDVSVALALRTPGVSFASGSAGSGLGPRYPQIGRASCRERVSIDV
jgi:hypothetical protein